MEPKIHFSAEPRQTYCRDAILADQSVPEWQMGEVVEECEYMMMTNEVNKKVPCIKLNTQALDNKPIKTVKFGTMYYLFTPIRLKYLPAGRHGAS